MLYNGPGDVPQTAPSPTGGGGGFASEVATLWRYTNTFIIIIIIFAFSALTPLAERQKGHPVCKKLSGGVLAQLSVWSEL